MYRQIAPWLPLPTKWTCYLPQAYIMWSSFLYWGGGCSLDESSSSKCIPTISPASPLPTDSISVWNSHLFLWSSHLLHNVGGPGGGGCPSYKCRLLTAELLTIAPCFPPHKMAVSLSLSFTSLYSVTLVFAGRGGGGSLGKLCLQLLQ